MKKIFVGQTKLTIELDLNQSLAGYESARIKYIKPSQTRGSWPANVVNSTTGLIAYEVESSNDLDEAGDWTIWGSVEFADDKSAPSAPVRMTVFKEGT
jgi:hypothetical protein